MLRGILAVVQRELEGAVAAESRTATVEVAPQRLYRRAQPHVSQRVRAAVAELSLGVRICAPAHDPAVAEHDERVP